MLDPAFFMGGARRAEMALEQVMAAKQDKGLLFLTVASGKDMQHRRLEVVVTDPVRYPAKMGECLNVAIEERLLLLGGKRHHKQTPGVAKAHEKKLHRDLSAGENDRAFTPIHLGIDARIEGKRQKNLRLLVLTTPLCQIAADMGGAARIAFRLEDRKDPGAGIPLLPGQRLVLFQQRIDPGFIRS